MPSAAATPTAMTTRTPRRWHRTISAVILGLVAVLTLSACGFRGLYSVTLPGGANIGDHPYRVTIDFVDVLDLVPQSAVKVNDVAVGRVETISLEDWHAKVTVVVNGDVSLPANARAVISQTSLLGEKYIGLEPPNDAAPQGKLSNGATIPLTRTGANTEVEQVLGALSLLLNGGGLQQISTITHELNNAFDGRTDKLRDLFTQLNTVTKSLDDQKSVITDAIDKLDTLADTLNQQKQVLVNTLDTLPGALSVLADERDNLVNLLTSLDTLSGTAVNVINQTQENFLKTLQELQPTLENLTKAGKDLGNAFELLGTYPFPKTSTKAIGGDYTNLTITLDADLGDLLNNLLKSACPPDAQSECTLNSPLPTSQIPVIGGLTGGTSGSSGSGGATGQSNGVQLLPTVPGASS